MSQSFKFSLSMNTLQAIEHHFFIIISEISYRCLNLSHQRFSLALKDVRLPCRTTDVLIRKRICFSLSILECIDFTFKILFLPSLSQTFCAARNGGVAAGTLGSRSQRMLLNPFPLTLTGIVDSVNCPSKSLENTFHSQFACEDVL